ncbi:replication endonuclease [Xenorhabdus nematophila]|uniref:replication endonuclease n=1 Tax=Xenorhabdus nematophila TaxID=628 RepID=UPI0032B71240
MRRQRTEYQPSLPAGATMAERLLWEVNAADHAWRYQYIGQMPDFLATYFSNRYKKIYTESGRNGRRRANTFLRKTIGENVLPRLNRVVARYSFHHRVSGVEPFPFIDDLDKLPVSDRTQIKSLAHNIAGFMTRNYEHYSSQYIGVPPHDERVAQQRLVDIYLLLARLTQSAGTTPPYWGLLAGRFDPDTTDQWCAGLLRMMSDKWWYHRLKRMRDIRAEHMAIAVGQVQKNASAYVSRGALREWQEQKRRNREFFKNFDLENEQGDRVSLAEMVIGSNANPAVRRCELMVRMRGFENVANEIGCVGEFYTITAPSRFHSVHSSGGFVQQWDGASPRDTQKYLCSVWARARAAIARRGINVFGFRVAEPHHDGTPHWHILLFMRPEHVESVRQILADYARAEDAHELNSDAARRARFHYEPIDPAKGSATGYIAKYISKNIDGYALDGETDDETGHSLRDMSRSVSAWASRWRIRQFQQIGGAPVSVWRELRRMGDARLAVDQVDAVIDAADSGDWAAYTQAQGGPLVSRNALVVRLAYEQIKSGSPYGEDVNRIQGICSPFISAPFVCTRIHEWKIVPKQSKSLVQQGEGFDFSGGAAAPWSSVNNCTGGSGTVSGNNQLVEKIIDYADSIGMSFSRLMARSLISSGKISIDKQPFRLWPGGRFIPVESERQKEARRDVLRQRIKNMGERRKNLL